MHMFRSFGKSSSRVRNLVYDCVYTCLRVSLDIFPIASQGMDSWEGLLYIGLCKAVEVAVGEGDYYFC